MTTPTAAIRDHHAAARRDERERTVSGLVATALGLIGTFGDDAEAVAMVRAWRSGDARWERVAGIIRAAFAAVPERTVTA